MVAGETKSITKDEDEEAAILADEMAAAHRLLTALDGRVGATAALGNTLAAVGFGLFLPWLYVIVQVCLGEGAGPSGLAENGSFMAVVAVAALALLFVGLRYRAASSRFAILALDLRNELTLARGASR